MKKILILGANKKQSHYIKIAKTLGFFVIATDLNENAHGVSFADKFYCVGYEDVKALIKIGLDNLFGENDKVFTASSQSSHISASLFAKKFGIDYISFNTVDVCINKINLYKQLKLLSASYPKTYICINKNDINKIVIKHPNIGFFVKSDYGKSPNYIYYFKGKVDKEIVFKKDRFFRGKYVVQEEVKGEHIRVNYNGGNFIYFKHIKGPWFDISRSIGKLGHIIENSLKKVLKSLYLQKNFVKFDIILTKDNYYLIDIGIDPPSRFQVLCRKIGFEFEKNYLLQNLNMKFSYPNLTDLKEPEVLVSHQRTFKV